MRLRYLQKFLFPTGKNNNRKYGIEEFDILKMSEADSAVEGRDSRLWASGLDCLYDEGLQPQVAS